MIEKISISFLNLSKLQLQKQQIHVEYNKSFPSLFNHVLQDEELIKNKVNFISFYILSHLQRRVSTNFAG